MTTNEALDHEVYAINMFCRLWPTPNNIHKHTFKIKKTPDPTIINHPNYKDSDKTSANEIPYWSDVWF